MHHWCLGNIEDYLKIWKASKACDHLHSPLHLFHGIAPNAFLHYNSDLTPRIPTVVTFPGYRQCLRSLNFDTICHFGWRVDPNRKTKNLPSVGIMSPNEPPPPGPPYASDLKPADDIRWLHGKVFLGPSRAKVFVSSPVASFGDDCIRLQGKDLRFIASAACEPRMPVVHLESKNSVFSTDFLRWNIKSSIFCAILLLSKKNIPLGDAGKPGKTTFLTRLPLGTLPAMGYSLQLVMAKVPLAATSPKAPTMPATPAAHSAPTLGKVSPWRVGCTGRSSRETWVKKWEVNLAVVVLNTYLDLVKLDSSSPSN